MVEYHVITLPQFQDIVDKSDRKEEFGGCLSVRMNLGERPISCLDQNEVIFKHCIFTKKMWNHKGKFCIVLNYEECDVVIIAL